MFNCFAKNAIDKSQPKFSSASAQLIGNAAMTNLSTLIDRDPVLRNNPKVSKSLVARHLELEQRLRRIGVEVKPRFRLSHPLATSERVYR